MENTAGHLRTILKRLGYDPDSGKPGFRVFAYVALAIALIVNNSYMLIADWTNLDTRLNTIKNEVSYIVFLGYAIVYLTSWNNFATLIRIIEDGIQRFPFNHVSRRRKEVADLATKKVTNQTRLMYHMLQAFFVTSTVVPFAIGTTIVVERRSDDIDVQSLPLTYPFYYPGRLKSIPGYYTVLLLQIFYHKLAVDYAYTTYASSFGAMRVVSAEIKLLQLGFLEMEDLISVDHDAARSHMSSRDEQEDSENRLRSFLKYVVSYHQRIYRKCGELNRGMQNIVLVFNSGVSIYICTAVYYLVEKIDNISKISVGFCCIFALYIIYTFCFCGEIIATEDKNLRDALYECSWVGKPMWFQNSLKILMARSMRQIELKPLGLFVLNLQKFAMTMNAIYSYYNIISRLKNK